MEALHYFIKSSIILAIFYGVYYLFMRKDTLFSAKRFFFITGLLTALVLPFLKISKIIYLEAPVYTPTPLLDQIPFNELKTISTTAAAPVSVPIDWWQIALICYVLVVAVLAIRFFIQLTTLLLLFKKSASETRDGYKYIEVTDIISPFSFFNFIVYNPELHSQEELVMIVAHEQIHGKQLHSIDMFLSQFITIIQWANPFSWCYKKAMEANLEFVADAQTITKIESKKQYQLTLVKASSSLPAPALTSPFYQSLIKKRILMLNKTTTHKRNLLKMTFVLPLLAFFFLSFNVKEEIVYKDTAAVTTDSLIITSETLETEISAIKKTINEGTTAFEVDFTDMQRDVSGNLTQLAIKTKFTHQSTFIKNVTYGGVDAHIPALKLSIEEDQLQFGDLEEKNIMRATARGVKALKFQKQETASTSNEKMGENPLYIINGKELLTSKLPKNSNYKVSKNIEEITPQTAKATYGNKAKDDAIIFNGVTKTHKDEAAPLSKEKEQHETTINTAFKYRITKNTTDAEFENIKRELQSKYDTKFNYSVSRNSSNEITSLSFNYSNSNGDSGSHSISDDNPIDDFIFHKTQKGFRFVTLENGENRENLHATARAEMLEKREKQLEKLEEKREEFIEQREQLMEERHQFTEQREQLMEESMQHKQSLQNNTRHNTVSTSVYTVHDGDKQITSTTGMPNTAHIYITKNTTDADLAAIKSEMKSKGIDFNYKRVRRNATNQITSIKIDCDNGKGDKSVISKKSNAPIEDIMIEI